VSRADGAGSEELISQSIELPRGELRVLQMRDSAQLPDAGEVEWAPMAPYWSVLWRSGVALAREIEGLPLDGKRVVELGCGLAVPSLAAARAGAEVLATDENAEALSQLERNAAVNEVRLETQRVRWSEPQGLVSRAPFDLVLGADVIYERASVAELLSLLPRLAPVAWLAEPGRPPAKAFFERANSQWSIETWTRGVVRISRIQFA
jgi:predicted nicotinamide N-methyase